MKKNPLSIGAWAMLLSVTILIAGCTGEDGAPGPAGTDGTNGSNGTDGKNGTNGKNGAGFDEAIAKGNVILILDGTRPDGVAFKDTIEYRFAPTNLDYSNVEDNTGTEKVTDVTTTVQRYQGYDGGARGGFVNIYNRVVAYNVGDPKTHEFYLNIDNTSIVFPSERKYFNLYTSEGSVRVRKTGDDIDGEFSYGVNSLDITSYGYDVLTTGKLVFKYTATIDEHYNSTGHALTVMVIADAYVYQYTWSSNGRQAQGSNGRVASGKPRKAEMISMD